MSIVQYYAVIHIEQAFGLRDMEAREQEGYIWRSSAMVGGLYVFYLLEGLVNYLVRLKQVSPVVLCCASLCCTPNRRMLLCSLFMGMLVIERISRLYCEY